MSSPLFQGSKRKARLLRQLDAALEREVATVKFELEAIRELAPYIRDEAHLSEILGAVEDEAMRAAIAKLLHPFLTFRASRVVLTDRQESTL